MLNEAGARRSIANYEGKIRASPTITPRNKEFLLEFKRKCSIDPAIGANRLRQIICHSYCIGELFGQLHFDKAVRQDVDIILERIDSIYKSNWTKSDKRKIMKKMFKVLFGDGEVYPHAVRAVKTGLGKDFIKAKESEAKDNVLTLDEIDRMVEGVTDIRYKSMVKFLFEAGPRIGELLSMRIKDVVFDEGEGFADVTLSGKTGMRQITIYVLVPLLRDLVESHPNKSPDTPLWYSVYLVF